MFSSFFANDIKVVCNVMHIIKTAKKFIPPKPAPKPATAASVAVKEMAVFNEALLCLEIVLISKTRRIAETLKRKKQPA